MAGSTNRALVDQIRHVFDTARQAGESLPGRPTLVRLTGATDHQVKKALADLARTRANGGDETASAGDAGDHQPPVGEGRFVSWTGFAFGAVMSIAANIMHTWLPAATEPPGWTPGLAPQIGAAVWPVGLLLSVEILSRVRWHQGKWWRIARYGGAGTVALGSAAISYGHLRDVLIAWGYGHPGADVGPLVLDGLMVVSGFALLATSRNQQHQR
jgi:Protein of unknown function (DUF2637)